MLLLFFSLLILESVASSSKFDNEIIGIPVVACEANGIRVRIETARPFDGRIYVRGEYHNAECSRSFTRGRSANSLTKDGWWSRKHPNDDNSNEEYPEEGDEKKTNRPEEWQSVGGSTGPRSRQPSFQVAFGGSRGDDRNPETENQQLKVFRGKQKVPSEPLRCPSVEEICPPCECGGRSRRQTHWVELVVPIGACNAKRDRIMNPPSLITSFVAVVSFHGSFITKIDRAYHIKCTFNETSLPVHTDLNVTMPDGARVMGVAEPPSCEYNLVDQNGRPVQNVRVGDLVRHEWKCEGTKSMRLLVHDCFVEGDGGIKQAVIDEHGCSLDAFALPTPEYSSDGMTARTDAYVFKFPDQTAVTFRCDMRTCHSSDPGCLEDTPPKCSSDGRRRRRRSTRSQRTESATLHSPTLTVLDMDSLKEDPSPPPPSEFCLSIAGFGVLVSATTFILTSSAAVVAIQHFSRRLT